MRRVLLLSTSLPLLLGGCGEKSSPESSPEEAASETKPLEAVSVNPYLKYEIKGDTVAITRCAESASGDFMIPTKIEGKTVTSIEQFAFRYCTNLTSITIPDRVTSIGGQAFYWCTSLRAATFLGDAPKIGDSAFEKSSPTIYRKAEAKGWGDTLAGRPVKLITEKP